MKKILVVLFFVCFGAKLYSSDSSDSSKEYQACSSGKLEQLFWLLTTQNNFDYFKQDIFDVKKFDKHVDILTSSSLDKRQSCEILHDMISNLARVKICAVHYDIAGIAVKIWLQNRCMYEQAEALESWFVGCKKSSNNKTDYSMYLKRAKEVQDHFEKKKAENMYEVLTRGIQYQLDLENKRALKAIFENR